MSTCELVDAPRGRRFCLEVALAADDQLRRMTFHAERAFDPDDGSVAIVWARHGAHEPLPPPASVAEVAAAVDRLAESAIDAVIDDTAEVLACLVRTVGSAYYWQRPDARDQLAAQPELRVGLTAVAERIDRRGLLSGWSAMWQGVGWRTQFSSGDADSAGAPERATRVERWRGQAIAREAAFRAQQRVAPEASWSSVWWSYPVDLDTTTGAVAGVPSGLALVEDELGWTEASVVPVRAEGRVLELDAPAWADLCRRYPLDVSLTVSGDWSRATGRTGAWVLPDWADVAAEWDAVHLSIEQYLLLAGRPVEVDDAYASLIAGWNPDATVWLRDGSVVQTGDPQTWIREETGGSGAVWSPAAVN